MEIKQKTAAISLIANICLTVVKFASFSFTGSLAILSEAWHSLSDIATSFLVWLAMRRQEKETAPAEKKSREEAIASGVIGFILLSVAVSLFYSILLSEKAPLQNSLMAGILFFIFGVSSFVVYKFETQVGLEHGSVGLTSDGLHSKSDMLASFLTGGSLIAYHFGFDIDRPVGFFIALLIFSLAIEIFFMIIRARPTSEPSDANEDPRILEFKTYQVLFALFDLRIFEKFQHSLKKNYDIRVEELPVIGFFVRNGFRVLIVILLLLYLSTGVFSVGPSQRGLIERFGKIQRDRELLTPGVHFKFPWPFEVGFTVESLSIQTMDIGIISGGESKALIWSREHGDGQPFLSGDNNFLYAYMTLHYRVPEPLLYLNLHSDPKELIRQVCTKTLTETFAQISLYSMFANERREIVGVIRDRLQKHLKSLDLGVQIVDVCLKDLHPPISVASSFESVVAEAQKKQTAILESFSYRNAQIPGVRAESENLVQRAKEYSLRLQHQANGESERFKMTETTFQETKGITKLRLYLESMQNTLKKTQIILVDKKAGCPSLFINSSKLSTGERESEIEEIREGDVGVPLPKLLDDVPPSTPEGTTGPEVEIDGTEF